MVDAIATEPDAAPIDVTANLRVEPGDYLLELQANARCSAETLRNGMMRLGFSEVLVDASAPAFRPQRAAKENDDRSILRFVGRLGVPLLLQKTEHLAWTGARKLSIDVLAELRLKVEPFALEPERLYEVRFLSRMRSQPTRELVVESLAEMGWETEKLSALRRDMRIPGRSGASVTLWFGLLRWTGPMSYITEDDPFYFEDVLAV